MEQTSHHAVKEIEDSPDDDEEQSHAAITLEGVISGNAARDEVAAGDGIGYMLFHLCQFCYHRLIAGSGLANGDTGPCRQRQEDIHTRTEFDKA